MGLCTEITRYRDIEIQRYRDTEIQIYREYRDTENTKIQRIQRYIEYRDTIGNTLNGKLSAQNKNLFGSLKSLRSLTRAN